MGEVTLIHLVRYWQACSFLFYSNEIFLDLTIKKKKKKKIIIRLYVFPPNRQVALWRIVYLYTSLFTPTKKCSCSGYWYYYDYYDDYQAVCEKWFSVLSRNVTTVTVKTSAVFSVCPPTSERGGNGSSSAGSCFLLIHFPVWLSQG